MKKAKSQLRINFVMKKEFFLHELLYVIIAQIGFVKKNFNFHISILIFNIFMLPS